MKKSAQKTANTLEKSKVSFRKHAVYLQKWKLKDCEQDICKFEIDWFPHRSRRYKGISIMVGSKFFGTYEFVLVSNFKGYLKENEEYPAYIGKKIL